MPSAFSAAKIFLTASVFSFHASAADFAWWLTPKLRWATSGVYFTLPVPATVTAACDVAASSNAPQTARIPFFHMTHRPFRPPREGRGTRVEMDESDESAVTGGCG